MMSWGLAWVIGQCPLHDSPGFISHDRMINRTKSKPDACPPAWPRIGTPLRRTPTVFALLLHGEEGGGSATGTQNICAAAVPPALTSHLDDDQGEEKAQSCVSMKLQHSANAKTSSGETPDDDTHFSFPPPPGNARRPKRILCSEFRDGIESRVPSSGAHSLAVAQRRNSHRISHAPRTSEHAHNSRPRTLQSRRCVSSGRMPGGRTTSNHMGTA